MTAGVGTAGHALSDRARLMLLTDFVGPNFGTESFGLFLYSLVRLQEPRVIVELGTGLGASAFWMALGVKHNGDGHVWTIDNLGTFKARPGILAQIADHLRVAGFGDISPESGEEYVRQVAEALDIDDVLTLIARSIELDEPTHFDDYPFDGEAIDLLFSDFSHGPANILKLLGHFLPRMAEASSIFIDSASTYWPSYLLLEQLTSQLNAGHVPKSLQRECRADLSVLMRDRRIVLVHITEPKDRAQNSTAWLKLEPIDVMAQPPARTRLA